MITVHFSNYKSFLDLHVESILGYCDDRKTKFRKSKLDLLVKNHFGKIVDDFKALIRASPEELRQIKLLFDSFSNNKKNEIKKQLGLKSLYNYFVQNKGHFNTNGAGIDYNSTYLASKLNAFTCPYCNENYTYSFHYEDEDHKLRRTYDWDHIYPKMHYPFLAISFFNLVPSCKVCNLIKSDKNKEYYNPHLPFNMDDFYFFDIDPIGAGFITDITKIKLNLVLKTSQYKKEVKETIAVIGLLERYNCHKDLLKHILNKKRIYTAEYITKLFTQVPGLTTLSVSDARTMLFGIYFNYSEYYKAPFSKLTNDILNSKY